MGFRAHVPSRYGCIAGAYERPMIAPSLGSHRVPTDAPLVRTGAERAVVRAAVVSAGRELRVEVEIAPRAQLRPRWWGSVLGMRRVVGEFDRSPPPAGCR